LRLHIKAGKDSQQDYQPFHSTVRWGWRKPKINQLFYNWRILAFPA
jgi:hypothetical protein